MSEISGNFEPDQSADVSKLEELVAGYLDELNSGQELDPMRILAENPGQGHEIIEALQGFIEFDSCLFNFH